MTLAAEAPRRVAFPTTWPALGAAGFVGPVRFERRFGCPGRIDAHERVWLVGEGMAGPVAISLLGPLGSVAKDTFAFDITARLRDRNLLAIELQATPDRVVLWEDIALEVRASAFLENVSNERLVVHGRVAGTSDKVLEVYALANGRSCGYSEVSAGQSFSIPIEEGSGPLRLELVHVSTVWDVVEIERP